MEHDASKHIFISLTEQELTQLIRTTLESVLQSCSGHAQVEEEILDIKGASAFTNIPVGTLYNWTSERKIPFYKPGKQILFSKLELLEWLKKHKVKTHTELTIAAKQHLDRKRAA